MTERVFISRGDAGIENISTKGHHQRKTSMRIVKGILTSVAAIFVIIQFIRPTKNVSDGLSPNDISVKYRIPHDIQSLIRSSCYDCHSNSTQYPWYAEVQPVGWFLNDDVQKGKKELNFSEFGSYPVRRQYIKLQGIIEQVTEEKMPLPAYLLMHPGAKLSQQKKDVIIAWANAMEDTIRAKYPPDSLARRR
jgi:hypothetical protein